MGACTFRSTGSIGYDDRILRRYVAEERVSIWAVGGRMKLSRHDKQSPGFIRGEQLLWHNTGQSSWTKGLLPKRLLEPTSSPATGYGRVKRREITGLILDECLMPELEDARSSA